MIKNRKFLLSVCLSVGLVALGLGFYLSGAEKESYPETKCRKNDNSFEIECLETVLKEIVGSGGAAQAFEVVERLGEVDELNTVNCHDFAHLIGREAYEVFAKGEDFEVSEKTAYCAYGFYHGFMETLVSESGDVRKAREFCEYVDAGLAEKGYGQQYACYHGIGHGWTNVHDPAFWGDERAMVYPALELCQKVTTDPEKLKICATGVFDSISIGYYNEVYGLKINREDPLWLCEEQEEKFKASCYMDMAPAILWLGDYRLEDSLNYLKLAEEKYRDILVRSLASGSVRFIFNRNERVEEKIDLCRSLDQELALSCVGGLVSGIVQFGPPDEEYVGAIDFCLREELTQVEQETCGLELVRYAQYRYPKEKSEEICNTVKAKINITCPSE